MANADDPRLPPAVADDTRIASGVQQCVLDAARAKHCGRAFHDVTLRDAAQIDPHAARLEEDRAPRTVEHYMTIVEGAEPLLDLPIRWPLVRAEIIEVA